MNTEQILMCVVALILGMLLANMLKDVYGCKLVESNTNYDCGVWCKTTPGIEDVNGCVSQCISDADPI